MTAAENGGRDAPSPADGATARTEQRAPVVRSEQRVLVEKVQPSVNGGRHPVKRVVGDRVVVEADLIADSHDVLAGRVLYRAPGESRWRSAPLAPLENDRHRGAFDIDALGRWQFAVEGFVDELSSFLGVLERKVAAVAQDTDDPAGPSPAAQALARTEEKDVIAHLRMGARLLRRLSERVPESRRARLAELAAVLDAAETDPTAAHAAALDPSLEEAARAHPDLARASRSAIFEIEVERPLARFGSWYEFFPRSCGPDGRHGTFRDCEERLRYAAAMGFDVVYLPPIHPIGRSFRKGPNNRLHAGDDDPGSPWAIGSAEGGHKSVHPELGTLEDFRAFLERARELGLEVALDVALQVSPDHPYVREHPEWFVKRPDGSIQYAENPPKKYQDIYPFDFQCEDAQGLWDELVSIFRFWIGQGVRIFRVDNPHTKSLPFWDYCIGQLKHEHPDTVFLAEAFTRPKLMYALARLGFSQSYTYFTWRTSKHELVEYFTELAQSEVAEYFRPSLWPNTPDILPEQLQFGGRPAFVSRLVLAATLSSSYGIYGPAFELMESRAREGSGEYADNEKYELKRWDVERADSLRHLIAHLNAIRRDNPALHEIRSLRFHATDNEMLLCYSKRAGDNVIVVAVNLDSHFKQSGFVELDIDALGISGPQPTFQVHDLLGGGRFLWHEARNYIELDPHTSPAHIFVLRHRVRTEQDFDYFA